MLGTSEKVRVSKAQRMLETGWRKACPLLEDLEDLWIDESSARARDMGNRRENEKRFDRA